MPQAIAGTFTYKELSGRWNCSYRTVQRDIRRYNAAPEDFIGKQPVFSLQTVQELEEKRRKDRAAKCKLPLNGQKVVSVKEARKFARRRNGRN